jgi:hypothetical protein
MSCCFLHSGTPAGVALVYLGLAPLSCPYCVAVGANNLALGNLSFDLCPGGFCMRKRKTLLDTGAVVEVQCSRMFSVPTIHTATSEFDRLNRSTSLSCIPTTILRIVRPTTFTSHHSLQLRGSLAAAQNQAVS